MFCSNCGKPVDDGAGFCPSCGAVIEPDEVMEVINDVQVAQPVQPQQTVQQAQVVPPVSQVQQPQGSYCAGCGAFVEAGQQFCPKCGTAKGGVKKVKADNEILKLAQTMIKTPVDGLAALYQSKDSKMPMIFVAVQAVLAIIYGFLLNSKLVSSYNEYIQNLTVNLTNSLTSILGDFLGGLAGLGGGLAGGFGAGFASELVEDMFGDSIDAAIISTLQLKSDLIGIGAILITSVVAIAAQVLILFLLMQVFKTKVAFMDAVKIYAAKSYWSAVCILISMVLILVSPWAAIGFILISGNFINHSIGQMLQIHSPESENQIFWVQLIFNIIEIVTIGLSVYYIIGVVSNSFVSYLGGILPFLEDIF